MRQGDELARLGVVGFGTMGSEIALLGACAGLDTAVYTRTQEAFDAASARLAKVLRVLSRDPKFFAVAAIADDAGRAAVLARLRRVDTLAALADCDCVIESVAEDLQLKRAIFAALDSACGPDALLATNTSSISITALAEGCAVPGRIVGMHFFNPPSMMQLVEVIPGAQTSAAAVESASALAQRFGKRAIRVKETPGFVVNRILVAIMVEALNLLEDGVATLEDIDEAMKLGAGFPLGPFKLADLVGLDVFLHTADSIFRDTGDAKYSAPDRLRRMVAEGKLGRKSREGFYKY